MDNIISLIQRIGSSGRVPAEKNAASCATRGSAKSHAHVPPPTAGTSHIGAKHT